MILTPEQRAVVRQAERVILAHDSSQNEVLKALAAVDALGVPSVSANFRHMLLEWREMDVPMPAKDKVVKPEAPPPTVSNPNPS